LGRGSSAKKVDKENLVLCDIKRKLSEIVKSNMRKSNCHFNRMKLVLPYVYQVSPSISTGKMGKLQLTFTDVLMPVDTIQCKPISGCMVTFPIWHQEL